MADDSEDANESVVDIDAAAMDFGEAGAAAAGVADDGVGKKRKRKEKKAPVATPSVRPVFDAATVEDALAFAAGQGYAPNSVSYFYIPDANGTHSWCRVCFKAGVHAGNQNKFSHLSSHTMWGDFKSMLVKLAARDQAKAAVRSGSLVSMFGSAAAVSEGAVVKLKPLKIDASQAKMLGDSVRGGRRRGLRGR